MAKIIDLEEYREKHKYSSAFREALDAVKETGKEPENKTPIKSTKIVDEYFKKHPCDFNKIKPTE